MKRVAVIGGGIFGCTAAVLAARAGHRVELFEAMPQLMQAASSINQYRLHRGYHYPRSPETVLASRLADATFRQEYSEAVIEGGRSLYAIARQGSQVTGAQYLTFCKQHDLEYRIVQEPELINSDLVELVIEGVETRFDPATLRSLAASRLMQSGVKLHLGAGAGRWMLDAFDKIVVAAYANTSTILAELGGVPQAYQFEVCEKPVVALPDSFGPVNIVVMDGPFMSVDPLGRTGHYVLGHVVHAIHATNTGFGPDIPQHLRSYLNQGIVRQGPTHFPEFREAGSRFIPALRQARHLGSMYTVRTVLGDRDSDDARPTIVAPAGDRLIKIFSGKIGTCVDAAQAAVALI